MEKNEHVHREYLQDSKEEGYKDGYDTDFSLHEQRRIIRRIDIRLVIITGFVRSTYTPHSHPLTYAFRCIASLSWIARTCQPLLLLGSYYVNARMMMRSDLMQNAQRSQTRGKQSLRMKRVPTASTVTDGS